MQRYKDYILESTYSTGFILLFSCAFHIFAQDMNIARAVVRAEPVRGEKFRRISFRFLLAEKWKKNILIIYAPPRVPER